MILYVYTLLRLCTLNICRSNKRKWFHFKKPKQTVIGQEGKGQGGILRAKKKLKTRSFIFMLWCFKKEI